MGLFYTISNIGTSKCSELAKKRLEKLEIYEQLVKEGCSQKTALKAINVSRATIYRWNKNYLDYGLLGLENESCKPNNVRKPTWNNELKQLVFKIRKKNPVWGKDKIATIINRDYGKAISSSMVGRILSLLVKQGIIKPISFYYGHVGVKKKRIFDNHAQRWEYEMQASKPGEFVQIDHATRKLIDGTIIKSFKAVDQITKWSEEQAYGSATALIATDFLKHVIEKFPFKIKSIMVDGGSEFMAEFEESCKGLDIDLYVLPPRSPKYNGCVEKGNSTTKYEFYNFYDGPSDLAAIRAKLEHFIHKYNTYRPHQALQYQTPLEYYQCLEAL